MVRVFITRELIHSHPLVLIWAESGPELNGLLKSFVFIKLRFFPTIDSELLPNDSTVHEPFSRCVRTDEPIQRIVRDRAQNRHLDLQSSSVTLCTRHSAGTVMPCRALILLALLGSAGCQHDKYGLKTKYEEELVVPPEEPRYNNPPESEYKPPPPKKEFRPGPGSGGGMGGMGGH